MSGKITGKILVLLMTIFSVINFTGCGQKDKTGIETEIIAASVRNPIHVIQAAQAGADISTIPYSLVLQMIKHPLTEQGLEKFKADWAAAFGK